MHLISKILTRGSFVLAIVLCGRPITYGQTATLAGKVVEEATGDPLPFANVFINNTTIGTTTAPDGTFELRNIPLGSVSLVVSYIGYKSVTYSFDLEENVVLTNAIALEFSDEELDELEVATTRDRRWERRFQRFQKVFLGTSAFAAQCSIVNPWVLEFSEERGKDGFTAISQVPLEINNYALGYRIFYHLRFFNAASNTFFFTGSARFVEMEADSSAQKATWVKNRMEAYQGSARHLFKAILFNNILEGQLMEEGFMVYQAKPGHENNSARSPFFSKESGVTVEPLVTDGLVTPSYRSGLYRILLSGRIEVHFSRSLGEPQNVFYKDLPFEISWIEVQADFVDVTKEGVDQRPDRLVVSGAMLEGRVAKMLPHDYVPANQHY